MQNLRLFVQKHKKTSYLILVSHLIFSGCFLFPFTSEKWPFDFTKAYLIIINYGLLAILFSTMLDKNKLIHVYLISLFFTILGVTSRYLLEYGEYSNILNFTQINILSYLFIIPIFCTVLCWVIDKLKVTTKK
ncbi:MAG: hypothetical protein ACRCX8_17220 [Sarcina sp.]